MVTEQKKWTRESGWQEISSNNLKDSAQLVLVFGDSKVLREGAYFPEVRGFYPTAHIVSASTAGEIVDTHVSDNTIVLTAIHFDKTNLQFGQTEISEASQSEECGIKLAKMLPTEGLIHVMVFSDGQKTNGTALVDGLIHTLPKNISVTGGLVGDGPDFKETCVGLDDKAVSGKIVVIGFYSDSLKIGYGSLGGWDPFGPERLITKAKDNVLYEMDNQPALKLYKEYLGDKASGLPSTGLLFPLNLHMKTENGEVDLVRTLLAVNEEDQSMTFAGTMPEGVNARLMKANFERLIDGAAGAASMSNESIEGHEPDLAILISCIGRKLVLKERVEEEVEAVRGRLGQKAAIIGFYSYGEICPTAAAEKQCQLHNQTMTITTFRED
jgi:hypothetical protein